MPNCLTLSAALARRGFTLFKGILAVKHNLERGSTRSDLTASIDRTDKEELPRSPRISIARLASGHPHILLTSN